MIRKCIIFFFIFSIIIMQGCGKSNDESDISIDLPSPVTSPSSFTINNIKTPESAHIEPISPYVGQAATGGQNEYALWRFNDFYNTEPNTLDWVFIGSSHSYCTFDPANFDDLGINSFQLGMPRQLVDGTYYTLMEILNYQQPHTVVLDLYWYVLETEFDREQVETFLNVIRNEDLKAVYRQEMAPLYEERGLEFLSFANNPSETAGEYYKGRGYVYIDSDMTQDAYDAILERPYHDMQNWQAHPRQEYYLEKIAELCVEQGIRLILTTAPVSNAYFSRIQHYNVHHEYIAGFADRHGLPYLDFITANTEIGLFENSCFFDAGHLNGRAIKKTNDFFIYWLNGQHE